MSERALVISFVALKGGVGKSILSLNLSSALRGEGKRVAIVDLDPQGSCLACGARAAELGLDGPTVIGMKGPTLLRDLPRVAEAFDVVIIDTPPKLGVEARSAMMASDLVLVPCTPASFDVWACAETIDVLYEARALRPELRAAVVLNRCDKTSIARSVETAAASLGVPLLEVVVQRRVAFADAALRGLGVVDTAPRSDAAREMRRLTRAVMEAARAPLAAVLEVAS